MINNVDWTRTAIYFGSSLSYAVYQNAYLDIAERRYRKLIWFSNYKVLGMIGDGGETV